MTATDDVTTPDVETADDFDAETFTTLVTNAMDAPTDPEAEDTQALLAHYRTLDRKGKAAGRKYIEDEAQKEVMQGNLAYAQALFSIRDLVVNAPKAPKERKPAAPRHNPTSGVVNSIAAIQIGYSLAMVSAHGNPTLDSDWQERIGEVATTEAQARAQAYMEWLIDKQPGEEPEAGEVEKAAARIALGRSPKGQGRKPKTEKVEPETDESGTLVADSDVTAAALAEL